MQTHRFTISQSGSVRRVASALGLERNVLAASAAVFFVGAGEELWKKFIPKYLEFLGAGPGAIGLFGTAKDFLDAIYQYPGGWIADQVGRRRAFLTFIGLSSIGYAIYLLTPSWPWLFAGLAFVMAWQSMASPAIFSVIGDALPKEKRALGFTVQSILKRIPIVFAPVAGSILIARYGLSGGMRLGFSFTLLLAVLTAILVRVINLPIVMGESANIRGVWNSFHEALKRLLISDVFIRTAEGMTEVFIILYVTNVAGAGVRQYGLLVAIQLMTSILVYIPAASIADRIGRKPFVILTFLCFAAFPLAVVLSKSFLHLVLAFVIGGMREIGEPSRKAMIVDFAEPHLRARSVGLYYLVRSLSITPAAALGGMLWKFSPQIPFLVASFIGLLGTIVFAVTVRKEYAS